MVFHTLCKDVSLSLFACPKHLLIGQNKKPIAKGSVVSKVGLLAERGTLGKGHWKDDLPPMCGGSRTDETEERWPATWQKLL